MIRPLDAVLFVVEDIASHVGLLVVAFSASFSSG